MLKKIASFFIYCLFQQFCISQVYNFQYLDSKSGLPQSQAYAICFDDREFAWIGTQGGGIAIYDGESIDYITQEDGLISNRVYALQFINDYIYCGIKDGLAIIDPVSHVVSSIPFPDDEELAQSIYYFNDKVWIGTNNGLYTLVDGQLNSKTAFSNLQVFSFFVEDDQKLWVCTNKGIWQADQPVNRLNTARGLYNDDVTSVVQNEGTWIISTYGGGLWYYDKESLKRFQYTKRLNSSIIHHMIRHQNTLWIATLNEGLFQFDLETKSLTQYTAEQGLSNNHVRTLAADHWGNLWIGTSGGGVSIFNNSPFVTYNKSNGLYNNYIYSVLKDRRKNLWVSTQGLGVQKINDTSSVLYNTYNGFKSTKSRAIFEDSKDRIWLGTEGEGLSIITNSDDTDTIYNFKKINGLGSDWIRSFTEDKKKQRLYIGSSNGIYYCNLNIEKIEEIQFIKQGGPLKNQRFSDLQWDEKVNALLFAGSDGAGFIKKNKVVFFESKAGFRNICSRDSIIWCGSEDRGVLQINFINDSTFTSKWLTTEDGLYSNNIYQITIDREFLWIGSEKGLSQWDTNDKVVKHYGYDEGFEGVETNVNANYKDSEGQVWFGTTDGLYVYNASNGYDSLQKLAPKVYFSDVQVFYESIENTVYGERYRQGKKLVLVHTDNHIGFGIKGHHFTFQNKIRYRWKLEGVDTKWSPPSKNQSATFSNLEPGSYKMLVQASIDKTWETEPIAFEFSILTPFWRKEWFIVSYVLLSVMILGTIVLLIIRRQKRKNVQFIEKIELEKSVLELEQKALRLQMNPHFIFNVLNSIHNLIILNDSSKARYALSKFSKLMRQVLENSRERLVSIDDELEMIQNYVQLEKLTGQLDFKFKVEIDDLVDTNEAVLPPLMVQPFIENAIIHGFKNIDYQGVITVKFFLESDSYLVCSIEDNGSGRLSAANNKAQKSQYHKSTALQVTQERLANLNNSAEQKDFKIEDLTGQNSQPAGTRITIRIKLP